jgi:ribonuclease E
VAAAPAAAPAPAAPLPVDLDAVLGSAGLTLAATDPEKLRAAREAAARVAPPVRVPRERKPAPQVADEPLVQVNTTRQ